MEVTIIDPKDYGIEETQAESIVSKLNQIVFERVELFEEYERVVELDAETTSSEVFKRLRLSISNNRTKQLEPARKADKELFLRGGQFVDARYNREITENQRREAVLLEKEKHNENIQKQKAKDLNDARIERLRPFVDDVTGLDFATMNDEDFDDYLLGKKTRFENAKIEALREKRHEIIMLIKGVVYNANQTYTLVNLLDYKMSNEINRKDLLDASEEKFNAFIDEFKVSEKDNVIYYENLEKENERLKAEAKEKDRLAKIESDKKDAIIAKQKSDAQAEVERLAKIETERLAKIEADKKAPIKKQLEVWVNDFQLPECTVYNATSIEITEKFEAFKKWSINQINNL